MKDKLPTFLDRGVETAVCTIYYLFDHAFMLEQTTPDYENSLKFGLTFHKYSVVIKICNYEPLKGAAYLKAK